jgi:hypothetical protein
MTRYKKQNLNDEETSSMGSVQFNEVNTSPNMHIRFANRVRFK